MDNFLLAVSHHTLLRRRDSEDDADLIAKSTPNTSRAEPISVPLSRVQTAYNSPSRGRSPTPPKVRFDTPAKQVRTSNTDVSGNSSQHNRSADVAIGGLGMVGAAEDGQERQSRGCTCKSEDGGAERPRSRSVKDV